MFRVISRFFISIPKANINWTGLIMARLFNVSLDIVWITFQEVIPSVVKYHNRLNFRNLMFLQSTGKMARKTNCRYFRLYLNMIYILSLSVTKPIFFKFCSRRLSAKKLNILFSLPWLHLSMFINTYTEWYQGYSSYYPSTRVCSLILLPTTGWFN